MPPRKARKRSHASPSVPSASPSTSPSESPSLSPSASPAEDSRAAPTPGRDPDDQAGNDLSEQQESLKRYQSEAAARVAARGGPNAVYTVADVACRLAQDLIDWAILEVALDVHHDQYLKSSDCPNVLQCTTEPSEKLLHGDDSVAHALSPSKNGTPGRHGFVHSHGTSLDSNSSRVLLSDKNVNVTCINCSSSTAASRYAQHLEKCLGRGGRSSSRAASARLKASAERAERSAMGEADELIPRKRRAALDASNLHTPVLAKDEEITYNDLPSLSSSPLAGNKGRAYRP